MKDRFLKNEGNAKQMNQVSRKISNGTKREIWRLLPEYLHKYWAFEIWDLLAMTT